MHKKIIEAALFTSSRPLTIKELSEIVGIGSLGSVKKMLKDLQKEYIDRGLEIIETPQGEWQMQVKKDFLPKVAHLTPYADLSEGCKRTLALVVYKEPVSQSEIIKIQGNKAYSYIKFLEKRGLIKTYKKGRTRMIELTQEFENYFGEEKEKIRQIMEEKLGSVGKAKKDEIMEEIEKEVENKEIKAKKGAEDNPIAPEENNVKSLQEVENLLEASAETIIEESEVESIEKDLPSAKLKKKEGAKAKKTSEGKKKLKKEKAGKVLVWTRNEK